MTDQYSNPTDKVSVPNRTGQKTAVAIPQRKEGPSEGEVYKEASEKTGPSAEGSIRTSVGVSEEHWGLTGKTFRKRILVEHRSRDQQEELKLLAWACLPLGDAESVQHRSIKVPWPSKKRNPGRLHAEPACETPQRGGGVATPHRIRKRSNEKSFWGPGNRFNENGRSLAGITYLRMSGPGEGGGLSFYVQRLNHSKKRKSVKKRAKSLATDGSPGSGKRRA